MAVLESVSLSPSNWTEPLVMICFFSSPLDSSKAKAVWKTLAMSVDTIDDPSEEGRLTGRGGYRSLAERTRTHSNTPSPGWYGFPVLIDFAIGNI